MNRLRTATLFPLALAAAFTTALSAAALEPGDPVLLSAKTLDGRFVQIEDYKGRLLVVHFWATWHQPSVRQLQTLRAVLDHTADQGVAMLGICLDDPEEGTVVLETILAGVTSSLADGATWDHALAHTQMPSLDTRFFTEAYAIPAVWVVSPEGEALWQGHPADLPEQLLGFLETHAPTADLEALLAEASTDEETVEAEVDTEAELAAMLAERNALLATAGQEIDATEALAAQAAREEAVVAAKATLLQAEDAWTADPPDYASALAALADIDPVAHPDPLVAAHGQRWSRVIAALEPDALAAFIAARDALPEAGFALDAFLATAEPIDPMEGKPAVDEARVESRVVRPVSRGLRDAQRGRHAEAYQSFSSVLNVALGRPEADEALIAVLRYEADEELMAEIAATENESAAQALLFVAKGHADSFREEEAAALIRELLEKYPETPTATEAQTLLESLDLPE